MTKAGYIIICISVVITSCSPANKLVYLDEWDGMYKLKELNSCCEESTPVRLDLKRLVQNKYEWKLFWTDTNLNDTLVGKAVYEEKMLKFFVENNEIADKYFVKSVKKK